MEEIIRLSSKKLNASEEILYTNINGAVVKSILLFNNNNSDKEVTLKLDSVTFLFKLAANETKIIDTPIVTNLIEASGENINIQISGIQL